MIVEFGYWNIDTRIKNKYGHRYFLAQHRLNPTKVECVFIRSDGLSGDAKLCQIIKDEKFIT